jgi:hypothetical protein
MNIMIWQVCSAHCLAMKSRCYTVRVCLLLERIWILIYTVSTVLVVLMRYRSYGKVSCIHMAIQIYAGPFRPIFFWGGGWGGDCTNHFGPPYVLGRLNFSWMVNLCAPLEKLGPVLDFSLGGGGGGGAALDISVDWIINRIHFIRVSC